MIGHGKLTADVVFLWWEETWVGHYRDVPELVRCYGVKGRESWQNLCCVVLCWVILMCQILLGKHMLTLMPNNTVLVYCNFPLSYLYWSDRKKAGLGKACAILFCTGLDFIPKSIKMVVELRKWKKEKGRDICEDLNDWIRNGEEKYK